MTPLQINLKRDRRSLAITWADGEVSSLPASVLRQRSQAAQAIRALLDGRELISDDVSVTNVEPIGSYAIRLVFSDGHDRGIYPWSYLREIADSLV